MKTKERESEASVTVDQAAAEDKKIIDQLKSYKKKFEPRWYLASAFYEGVHFTFGQKDKDGNWLRVPTPKNKKIREIPKAKKQLKNLRNMILKLKQQPVTYPDMNIIEYDNAEDAEAVKREEDHAIKQGKYVNWFLNEKLKLARHLKKLVKNAQLHNVSYIQLLNSDGKKELAVYDAFDISIFPTITNINDHPHTVKHVTMRLSDLEKDESYDQTVIADIKGSIQSGKYSDSTYKDSLMKERYGNAPEDLVLIDEKYSVEEVTQKTEKDGELVDGETEIKCHIKAYIGGKKVRDEVTKLNMTPISMFCWEDEAYQASIMEDMMELNKSYDIFISKLEQKAKKLDTGRMLVHKGEDGKVYTTNDGEIVRFRRIKPEVMQEAGVPNAFMEAINMIENDLREQGVSVGAMSAIPAGVKAWRAIETLKESDYASLGTQIDNLSECLTDLTEKVIEMLAYDITEIENVQIKNARDGKMERFKVIGKRGADIYKQANPDKKLPSDVIVIDPNRSTKVEIESSLAYTEQAKQDIVMEMMDKGWIPLEIGLDMLRVGNTQEIMDKLKEQMLNGKSMIDMPDFQMLPPDLQKAIARFLADGATVTNPNPTNNPTNVPAATPPAPAPAGGGGKAPWKK